MAQHKGTPRGFLRIARQSAGIESGNALRTQGTLSAEGHKRELLRNSEGFPRPGLTHPRPRRMTTLISGGGMSNSVPVPCGL